MLHRKIVLASSSPRRKELLSGLGIQFEIFSPDIPEDVAPGESPWNLARRLAYEKWGNVASKSGFEDYLVITADTVVDLDGRSLGKPISREEAFEMLQALRAREHLVHTAVCAGDRTLLICSVVTTRVKMRDYSDEEIVSYVETGSPMDKAGGYAVQDEFFSPVERMEGSYTNVVGLPLEAMVRMLERFNIKMLGGAAVVR